MIRLRAKHAQNTGQILGSAPQTLLDNEIKTYGQIIRLKSGINVTSEIKTGNPLTGNEIPQREHAREEGCFIVAFD